jgi:hypothetical protein
LIMTPFLIIIPYIYWLTEFCESLFSCPVHRWFLVSPSIGWKPRLDLSFLVVVSDVRPSGGVGLTSDVWRQPLVRPDVIFFWKKNPWFFKKDPLFFPLKTGPLGGRGGIVKTYRTPLVGFTDKTNTTDIQAVHWDYSKTIHQEMEEDHKTMHTTKELRNIRVKLNWEEHSKHIWILFISITMVNKYYVYTSWYMSLHIYIYICSCDRCVSTLRCSTYDSSSCCMWQNALSMMK